MVNTDTEARSAAGQKRQPGGRMIEPSKYSSMMNGTLVASAAVVTRCDMLPGMKSLAAAATMVLVAALVKPLLQRRFWG